MPQLEAHESFLAVQRTGIGSGAMQPGPRSDVLRRWQAALPGEGRRVANRQTLQAAGFRVRRVTRG